MQVLLDFILKFFKPKFHNKLTWFITITGAGLISTPLIERLIDLVFRLQGESGIFGPNDVTYGFILIIIGLVYNIAYNLLLEKKREIEKDQPITKEDKDILLSNLEKRVLISIVVIIAIIAAVFIPNLFAESKGADAIFGLLLMLVGTPLFMVVGFLSYGLLLSYLKIKPLTDYLPSLDLTIDDSSTSKKKL